MFGCGLFSELGVWSFLFYEFIVEGVYPFPDAVYMCFSGTVFETNSYCVDCSVDVAKFVVY